MFLNTGSRLYIKIPSYFPPKFLKYDVLFPNTCSHLGIFRKLLCMILIPNPWLFGLSDKRSKPPKKWRFTWSQMTDPGSISLIGRKQCCVNWLHAGGACEGSHQPVIYTVQVIDVHARQKSNWVPINKVHHTDHTLPDLFFWSISSRVIDSFRQMLYKAYSLSYPNLFLFSQLSC